MIVLESTPDTLNNGADMTSKKRVTIQVDTANDLPTPQNNWAPGSICIIAATHTYKVLNEQGEWV